MNRILLVGFLAFALAPLARAQDAPAKKADSSSVEQLKANPNDAVALNQYLGKTFRKIASLSNANPDKAEQELKALAELLETLQPEQANAKRLVASGKRAIRSYQSRIDLARTTVAELEQKLKDNPNDAKALSQYASKISGELTPIALEQPLVAEKKLTAATDFLAALKEASDDPATAKAVDRAVGSLRRVESRIAAGKLVGTDAVPLEGVAWVNGGSLTADDVRGKVVLLDFWAVWCGPCIATFPHLIEWNEEYGDKGLVIVGATSYYKYKWDEEKGRATRSTEPVSPEDEHAMLGKFAEQHKLKHRFLLQKDRGLSSHYAVSGIPHVVVIDRSGKVRLVRIGSGPQNAKEIGDLLAQLIAEEPPAQ